MAKEDWKGGEYVALHCSNDDSHVVVDVNAVVYDGCLKVGDKVKFAFPGCKALQTGEVKGIDDDYKKMVNVCETLNKTTKPKRNKSFDGSVPRKSALRRGQAKAAAAADTEDIAAKPKEPTKITGSKARRGKEKASTQPKLKPPMKSSPLEKLLWEVSDEEIESSGSTSSSRSNSLARPELNPRKDLPPGLSLRDDKNDSDDSTSAPLTLEEIAVIRQVAKRRKISDINDLMKFAEASGCSKDMSEHPLRGNTDFEMDNTEIIGDIDMTEVTKVESKETQRNVEDSVMAERESRGSKKDQVKSAPSQSQEPRKSDKPSLSGNSAATHSTADSKKSDHPHPFKIMPTSQVKQGSRMQRGKKDSTSDQIFIEFEGAMLQILPSDVKVKNDNIKKETVLFSNENIRVEKLCSDFDIYVQEKDLRALKARCYTASALVRGLMRYVFTDAARQMCSVSGKPSMTKGQVKPEVRTPLDQEAVGAIIEYAQSRAAKKSWKVPESSSCKQYMANLLCEERAAVRSATKEEEASDSDPDHK